MKLGIMQPYVFPYLGYFQLIGAVDKFVVYDDVAFIKQGWVNRNMILVGGRACRFSVPLRAASSFKRIDEIEVDQDSYARWLRKFLTTVDQNYREAPCYGPVRELVASVFEGFSGSIAALAVRSLAETAHYLDLRTPIVESSTKYGNGDLKGTERVIDICMKEHAEEYVNAIGGKELYASEEFAARGIRLHFLRSRSVMYRQSGDRFTPGLSIIDVMMFNAPRRIGELLEEFDVV
jgi:hypothetical protein